MNANQDSRPNRSNFAPVSQSKPLSRGDSLSLIRNGTSQSSDGLRSRERLEIDLPGIQRHAKWSCDSWAGFLFTALNHHADNIRLHVFPRIDEHADLINLNDALELASAFQREDGDPSASLGIASPCLAHYAGYQLSDAFIHSCNALYTVRAPLLESLLGAVGDAKGDVLLAEALAIAEQVLGYQGVSTELAVPGRSGPTRLQECAIQARAYYIQFTYVVPLAQARNQADLDRTPIERSES